MDITEVISKLLSGDSIDNISQRTGAAQVDVKKVLASALPNLLSGVEQQTKDDDKVEGFAGALASHSQDDASDLAAFLNNVDLEDGGKIVGHLLGAGREDATQKAANASGLNLANTGKILALAAPLLMTLLGQQTNQSQQQQPTQNPSMLSGLMGNLLGNMDLGGLLLKLLGMK
ncbi:MAG: DUF937 domain-containing protein [Firmicutes bacterium]|nr:DUF937 domain-containing protein [Bacillota bacterium]